MHLFGNSFINGYLIVGKSIILPIGGLTIINPIVKPIVKAISQNKPDSRTFLWIAVDFVIFKLFQVFDFDSYCASYSGLIFNKVTVFKD